MKASSKPDVFLDRDGVIIRDRPDYIKSWDEVVLLPGSVDAITRLCRAGHRVMVATNQSAVGRGLISVERLDAIHRKLNAIVEADGGKITRFFVCLHSPQAGCYCRKPRPGLFYQAERQENVDLASSYMVGDQLSDLQAASAVRSRCILLPPAGAWVSHEPVNCGWFRAPTLAAAADIILGDADDSIWSPPGAGGVAAPVALGGPVESRDEKECSLRRDS